MNKRNVKLLIIVRVIKQQRDETQAKEKIFKYNFDQIEIQLL